MSSSSQFPHTVLYTYTVPPTGWAGLGWVGLGWVGLGWVGLGWASAVLLNWFASVQVSPFFKNLFPWNSFSQEQRTQNKNKNKKENTPNGSTHTPSSHDTTRTPPPCTMIGYPAPAMAMASRPVTSQGDGICCSARRRNATRRVCATAEQLNSIRASVAVGTSAEVQTLVCGGSGQWRQDVHAGFHGRGHCGRGFRWRCAGR